ncbi:hypothetical protein SeMB42_g06794 [Synchytrium endobioticum]|uniref:FAD-binding FR-type domain-containing protein n=1 Tax=Synchytrium endobioticum TaxID=286115 RepID=A0A507CJE7_9FUNG|nr:hypothetical protein SeMB42_g06794 [Synchytrium endobioticum]
MKTRNIVISNVFVLVACFGLALGLILGTANGQLHCFSATCEGLEHNKNVPVLASLAAFYALLLITAIILLVAQRCRTLNSWLIRVPSEYWLGLTIGEILFLVGAFGVIGLKAGWFLQIYFGHYTPSVPPQNYYYSFFNAFTHWTGTPLDVLLGFTMLATSKNSIIAVLGVPFDKALRLHRFMGYMMWWAVVLHGVSYTFKTCLNVNTVSFWSATFKVGVPASKITYFNLRDTWGAAAFLSMAPAVFFALPYFRRANFQLFHVAHYLMLVMILFSIFHSDTNLYFVAPGLMLWLTDFIFYAKSVSEPLRITRVCEEKCGFFTIDITAKEPVDFKPSAYYFLMVPAISRMEFHPFSIVSPPNTKTLTFMMMSTHTRAGKTVVSDWTHRLKSLLTRVDEETALNLHYHHAAGLASDATTMGTCMNDLTPVHYRPVDVNVCLTGPYGVMSFDPNEVSVLGVFVTSTGLAPALSLIRSRRLHPTTSIYVFWSLRQAHGEEHSLVAQTIAECQSQVKFFIYTTSEDYVNSDVKERSISPSLHVYHSRMDVAELMKTHLRPSLRSAKQYGVKAKLGLFLCGGAGFTIGSWN